MLNRIGFYTAASIFIILFVYSLLWFWAADRIRGQLESFMADADRKEIVIMPRALGIKGYPLTPEVVFAGRVSIDDIVIEIPHVEVRSLFLPERPVEITAPEGLSILTSESVEIWSVDSFTATSVIPLSLPQTTAHEDLMAWRKDGGRFALTSYDLRKQGLHMTGDGYVELDDMLQPSGVLKARITGHMVFLYWLEQERLINTKQALLAAAVMTGLTRKDAEGGGPDYMEAELTLQNRTLLFGPLQLAKLPPIEWGWRNPPGQLR